MFTETVKRFTHIIIISQLIVFSVLTFSSEDSEPKLKNLLPSELKKTEFNISRAKFEKSRPNARLVEDLSFRLVYQEDINANGITSIVYYLDNEGQQPLYEIIVNYDNESTMELKANKLLGKSNYSGKDGKSKEWKFDLKKEFPLHVWTFKNKIVYVYPLLNTEWNESGVIDLE